MFETRLLIHVIFLGIRFRIVIFNGTGTNPESES